MFKTSVKKKSKLQPLTSLRFGAAFCIFLLHASNHDLIANGFVSGVDLSKAVTFFFVLSGFVLSYAYAGRVYTLRSFWRARLARIWPAALASILLVPLLLPRNLFLPEVSSSWSIGTVLALCLTGLQSWIPIPVVFFGINAVTWSISVEASFYAVFPFLERCGAMKLLLSTLVLEMLCIYLAHFLAILNIPAYSNLTLNTQVWQGWLYINPVARMPEFMVGILFGKFYQSGQLQRLMTAREAIAKKNIAIYSFLESLFILLLVRAGLSYFALPLPIQVQSVINQFLSSIICGFLVVVAATGQGLLCRLLSWHPLVFLGEISYGLYLYHQPIMIRAAQSGGIDFLGLQLLPDTLFAVLVWSFGLSVISYRLLEVPARRLLSPARVQSAN